MKSAVKPFFLNVLLGAFLLSVGVFHFAWGLLPPTINRISPVDSAVDVPDFFSNDMAVESFAPELGMAFAPKRVSFIVPSDPLLTARPFTVELIARVDSRDGFNIFLANEEKSSPRLGIIHVCRFRTTVVVCSGKPSGTNDRKRL